MLRKFLNKTEADFIVMVCQENLPFSRNMVENRSDLILICNMLERINMYEKRVSLQQIWDLFNPRCPRVAHR
jgi:hypothetical protein